MQTSELLVEQHVEINNQPPVTAINCNTSSKKLHVISIVVLALGITAILTNGCSYIFTTRFNYDKFGINFVLLNIGYGLWSGICVSIKRSVHCTVLCVNYCIYTTVFVEVIA